MSIPLLQQRFEAYATNTLRDAQNALENANDSNDLELQLSRLNLLLEMYNQVHHFYDNDVLRNHLNEIEFLKTRLVQRMGFLNNDSSFAIKNFVQKKKTGGRPKILIDEDVIKLLRELHFEWTKIGKIFNVSARTLSRRRDEYNIEDTIPPHSTISDNALDIIVKRIKYEQPFYGQVMMMGALKSEGIHITRQRLRDSIQRVDALGTVNRRMNIILRRTYKVAGPNALWHIDGHHKLIRWKIVIHAGIDGYSRLITYINCSNNNRSDTVFKYFKEATERFGTPSRVRADKGGENVRVKRFMNEFRGEGRGSFIEGRSVHNQRIERLWVDLVKDVVKMYTTIFIYLEDKCGLDINNDVYIFCLHYVFIPRINKSLEQWKKSWNSHKIRTEGHHSPLQLYTRGMIECGYRGLEDTNIDPNEYGIDWHGPNPEEDNDNTVLIVVNESRNILTQDQKLLLQSLINPLQEDNNGYGINVYNQTVKTVAQILTLNN